MDRATLVGLDKQHVWHPYTAMEQYIAKTDPLVVVRAEGPGGDPLGQGGKDWHERSG